jgi:hypothetical protein
MPYENLLPSRVESILAMKTALTTLDETVWTLGYLWRLSGESTPPNIGMQLDNMLKISTQIRNELASSLLLEGSTTSSSTSSSSPP